MSVRLTSQESRVALFDSVTGYAFGPTFDSDEDAESFVAFVRDISGQDPREISRLAVYLERWQTQQFNEGKPWKAGYASAEREIH